MVVEGVRSGDVEGGLNGTSEGVWVMYTKGEREVKARTMMSKRVSRLTVKGMFLMTMAFGMISSSEWCEEGAGM